MQLTDLTAYLTDLLDADRGTDFCPNGLQVEGKSEVATVVTGVSACQELFDRARESGADCVLVHHGLFWSGGARSAPPPLTGLLYRRVAGLIKHDISLLAYHLPLDRHPELGNNALALERLGVEGRKPFAEFGGEFVGFHGCFSSPLPIEALLDRCDRVFLQRPLTVGTGPAEVSTLGIVSGGGENVLHEAIELGLDAYITGEIKEWVMNVANEAGIHYLAAGHYATERLGIRALGEHLAEKFGLTVEFIDVANPT